RGGGFTSWAPGEAALRGTVGPGRCAKTSAGLTGPQKSDGGEEVRGPGESFKPKVFVMSLGLNDRQSVVENGKVTLETTPEYPAKYKERVTAALTSAAAVNASLLWVGLPAMREPAAARDAREKNRLLPEPTPEFPDP